MVTHGRFLNFTPTSLCRFVASHSMADLTSAFHEGLVSLQPLMAEPSIFATSLRIIAEVRRPLPLTCSDLTSWGALLTLTRNSNM